ncbi:TetR/AcrR family transcriptional regulator [Desulforamulus aquiferis]|uniref:TetR/AcrR family transcriptional regulator n=1 Tax=Desulforamulus aquiferis TaxID=1397668 RepID=A0AAW7ZAK5_9FIRM|nr:TetR/AcrR family transcriptional regulator [Desulforamulus aquiferis]MDO7786743.1 TetR/AcrR family transcriptional regulator [Desulforamulus aquiferis]RYD06061.1 hypothetical protein N752_05910 [Desulforamulus aquiferis]
MNKEKISKRTAKADETKRKIYESADQLFKKHGFDNVSVDSIVEKAGVSKGCFYVYFDSKNALITTLIADFVDTIDLDYKSYLESFPPGTMASDILFSFVEKMVNTIACTLGYDLIKMLYEAQISRTVNTEAVMGYNRKLYQVFSSIISQGIKQGDFRTDISVDTITKHCIMAMRGLTYEWCIRYPYFDLNDQSLQHFEILLNGIKKQKAPA